MKILPKSLTLPEEIHIKLADIITFVGFIASVFGTFMIFQQHFYLAYGLIIIQLITDYFDGKIARKSKTENNFGANLDSFSDFYNIVNTAFLGFFMGMTHITTYPILIWFIFAGMLRLSIFAIIGTGNNGYFKGIPTTATTGILCTLLILNYKFTLIDINIFLFIFLFFAILMPSSL